MRIFTSILVAGALYVVMAGGANAQSNLQNTGGNTQTGGAQNTQTLQTEATAPVQQNQTGEALQQNQVDSLGVVGSPSQNEPSIVVGPADTTNEPGEGMGDNTNYWPVVGAMLAVAAVMIGINAYQRSVQQNMQAPSQSKDPIQANEKSPELQTKKQPVKKTVSKTGAAKKKKKKAHR